MLLQCEVTLVRQGSVLPLYTSLSPVFCLSLFLPLWLSAPFPPAPQSPSLSICLSIALTSPFSLKLFSSSLVAPFPPLFFILSIYLDLSFFSHIVLLFRSLSHGFTQPFSASLILFSLCPSPLYLGFTSLSSCLDYQV